MKFRHTETNTIDTTDIIRVDSITIKTEIDESPDLSYLDADNDPEYAHDNAIRLRNYRHGYWHCVGIWAECQVSYSIGGRDRRMESFQSGGLWGIESDSDQSYFDEVAQEEIAQLRAHVARFNVDMDSFDRCAKGAKR